MSTVIRVTRAWGCAVEGEALVMREGFSPRYDLDRWTGVISRIGHSVEGQSIKDRILVIPTSKGGVAGGWAFFDLLHKGIAPRALVFGKLNPVMVQGAVLAGMPISEGWSVDALAHIDTGDRIAPAPPGEPLKVTRKSRAPPACAVLANLGGASASVATPARHEARNNRAATQSLHRPAKP